MVTFLQSGFNRILFYFFVSAAVLMSQSAFAQATFSVVCPNKTIGKNDVLEIQFKMENANNVESIVPPDFKNFNIISGPNQESSSSNINGKISQYVSIGFSLQPKKPGKFTIGPAKAVADGKEYESAPVTVQVTNASSVLPKNSNSPGSNLLSPFAGFSFDVPSAPVEHQFDDYILKPGENVSAKIQKNLFVKLDVSKTNCYVGEPIVASFKLYTRLHSETTISSAPSFNGFSVSDLDVNNDVHTEKYNGRMYNVYTLRKVELYPLQSGKITLDPVVADNKVTFIKSDYANSQANNGFFDMLQNFGDAGVPASGLDEQNLTLTTAPVTVDVKPLPLDNKPKNFRGAVGNFNISSSLQKNNITTDDAGNLKVVISGKGNIQLVNAPTIVWPAGIDAYDASVQDNVDKSQVPMQGSKVFSFPFTLSKPGNYRIDSISFSYFDPESATYKTVYTPELSLQVSKGSGHPKNSFVQNEKKASENNPLISTRTEWIVGIFLFLGIIILILFSIIKKNKNKDDLETKIKLDDLKNEQEENKKEFIIPESPLLAAHEMLVTENSTGFFSILDSSIKNYLASKFKVPVNELNRKRLNEELDQCNVSLGTSLMLTSLLDEIEINLYAPPSSVRHLNNIFENASEVVSLLDKQVCR
jgi:hypothetical protein